MQQLLDTSIQETREYINTLMQNNSVTLYSAKNAPSWPASENSGVVLLPDLAVELGSPDTTSVSYQMWSETPSIINDNAITVIGPDIASAAEKCLPFGKIILAEVEGFTENNAADRTRDMFLSKFDVSLDGFMLKAASNYLAEWCRISKNARNKNFSFQILGSALINELKKLDFVTSVEVIFVTSSDEDVAGLFKIGNRAVRIVNALSKMMNEMSYDCSVCEFQDVCEDADELKELREQLADD